MVNAATVVRDVEDLTREPLEYQGQRCITLGMMDEVHGRPEGTAGRAFRAHREKMQEGRHYLVAPDATVRRFASDRGPTQGGGRDVVLLTERGYLVLVKTFQCHHRTGWAPFSTGPTEPPCPRGSARVVG
jgi:hypothetical protein